MHFKTFKAHASHRVLVLLALGALLPLPALAQNNETPVFTPASAWTVGSTELSNVRGLNSVKMPCVISNEFDNGFVVRFSGGGNKLLAMAVDFRQDVFKQGKKYDAMVSIGDTYAKQVSATAFTPNTLIFNLRPLTDFYSAIKTGQTLEVSIDQNIMKFTLGKLAAALPDMESCYAGAKTAPIKPMVDAPRIADNGNDLPRSASAPVAKVEAQEVAAPTPLLPADIAAKPLPQSFDEIVKDADAGVTPMPAQKKMQVSQVTPQPAAKEIPRGPEGNVAPDPVVQPKQVSRAMDTGANVPQKSITPMPLTAAPVAVAQAPVIPMPAATTAAAKPLPLPPVQAAAPAPKTWDAKAGEDMKIVLSRWAERAGYDLQWQADQDGKVAQDIMMSGSFEDAVGQLLAENSAATGIAGHVQSDAGKKDLSRKVAVADPAPQPPATKAIIPALHSDWSAPAGANIQTIIDQWSAKAGVAVVWQSYMSIPLKAPVNLTGSYEEAVQTLLDQYQNDSSGRPVGQLNIDPESGQRTLLMNMNVSG